MEGNTLEIKIKKQLEFIKQQISRFKRAFQTKQLKYQNFTPYLQALNKVFDLNNQYGEDYHQFIDKKNLHFLLRNNRELMKDVTQKLKGLSIYFQQNKIQPKEKLKKNDGICNICQQLIDSQNIQQAKNSVEDVGLNKLKRMLQMIQQEGNKAMFTPQEDLQFFQQLHRVLTKKQQLLSITDNHLQKYLDDIMKNMQQIKNLEDLKDTSFSMPQQIDWQTKIKNQINFVLLGSFKGKVPTWIQKMFDYFIKLHSKFTRQLKESKQCQTEPYVQDQVLELRNRIEEYKEHQKANKSINQDYLKMIQEKDQRLQNFEIQIKVIKENLSKQEMGRISKRLNKLNDLKQVKQEKSYRNSQRKSEINQKPNGKSKSQHKFKKISKMNSSLMNESLNQSSLIRKINNETDENQLFAQKMNTSKGKSPRNQHLVTEHLPEIQSNNFEEKIIRKKHKKLTDIQHFKKTMSNQKYQSFLPNIEKLIKDSKGQQNYHGIKKTSILTNYYQPVHRPSQKNQILEKLQFSALREKVDQEKSIEEIDQDTLKYNTESEINLSGNFTDSEKNIRLKKYKQKVSDVQNQLQNKVHKIQALKKTFEMKKLNTSASFTAKVSPLYNELSPLNMMNGQRFSSSIMSGLNLKKPQMKDFTTQTQKQQMQKESFVQQKNFANDKKSPRYIRFKSQEKNEQQYQEKKVPIDVEPTQKPTKQSILKKFVNHENLCKISEDHLEKILSKLLLIDSIKNEEIRSPIKSTHRDFNRKSSRFQQTKKSLSRSKVDKNKSDSQKQNVNEKSQQKQESVPKLLNMTKISLKQKLIENGGSRDISPTTKSKKTPNVNQVQQNLPNISGVHTKNKKNPDSCQFTKKDFSLFINQENSFKYESNMGKKYHKTPSIQLTKKQIQSLTSVYGLTQIIKSHSPQHYSQIISFIKYPYHSVVNNFSILNIIKDMSLETWLWHFSLIKFYHKKCIDINDQTQCICEHVEKFFNKIQDMLADVVKQRISNQIRLYSSQDMKT